MARIMELAFYISGLNNKVCRETERYIHDLLGIAARLHGPIITNLASWWTVLKKTCENKIMTMTISSRKSHVVTLIRCWKYAESRRYDQLWYSLIKYGIVIDEAICTPFHDDSIPFVWCRIIFQYYLMMTIHSFSFGMKKIKIVNRMTYNVVLGMGNVILPCSGSK